MQYVHAVAIRKMCAACLVGVHSEAIQKDRRKTFQYRDLMLINVSGELPIDA